MLAKSKARRAPNPARHCKPWTEDEQTLFLDLVRQGVPNKVIAERLQRTLATVNQRKVQQGLAVRTGVCEYCGKPTTDLGHGRPRRFHDDCLRRIHADRAMAKSAARRARLMQARSSWVCQQCGGPLPTDNPARKYCSVQCGKRAWHERSYGTPARMESLARSAAKKRARQQAERKDDVTTVTSKPTPKSIRQPVPPLPRPPEPSVPESSTELHPSIPTVATEIDIDPHLAALWLSFNTHNRPLKVTNLEKISADLLAGRWKYTAEPIKFSKTGVLLDGQHRLHAIVRTGITARCLVVPGLEDEAQDVMDTGAARGAADSLALAGETNTPILAAAIRIAIQMERGSLSNKTIITNSEIYAWLGTHPEMRDAVATASRLKRMHLSRSVIAYCIWHLAQLDQEATVEFFTDLSEHRTDGSGDPRSALLSRLTSVKDQSIKLTQAAQISLIFRTWNFVRAGKPLGRIAVHYSGNSVDIPTPK